MWIPKSLNWDTVSIKEGTIFINGQEQDLELKVRIRVTEEQINYIRSKLIPEIRAHDESLTEAWVGRHLKDDAIQLFMLDCITGYVDGCEDLTVRFNENVLICYQSKEARVRGIMPKGWDPIEDFQKIL